MEAGIEAAMKYKAEKRAKEGKPPRRKIGTNVVEPENEVNWEMAKAAILAFPDMAVASQFLADKGISASPKRLENLRRYHHDELAEKRKALAPQLEANFADGALDVARAATMAEHLAVERTTELLEKGLVQDPSKVARDLADVKAKNIDKRFAVEGRPTVVTHDRSHEEIIEKLVSMKVLKPSVDSTAEEVS